MTYNEVLTWIHSFDKFGVVPGLDRVRALCAELGAPQNKLQYIHVSGTNGKGSVCTEVANVLKCAGYKVGLYTSPEVIDFCERMQINGNMISSAELCAVAEPVKKAVDHLNSCGVFPTQFEVVTAAAFLWFAFEVVTAAAFLWFAQSGCHIVVLETGLGGRYDATNVIENPLVCAVVSVSLDHVAILGDTLEKIAYEKGGIVKPGADVIAAASIPDEARNVICGIAAEKKCGIRFADEKQMFHLARLNENRIGYKDCIFSLPFFGYHQVQNAAVTVSICEALIRRGFDISFRHIADGISGSRIPARTEIISKRPLVMLDGCHNDASTAGLANVLRDRFAGKRLLAVMGMMADKDCKKSVANLAPFFSYVITVNPSNPRSAASSDLADTVRDCGVEAFAADSPQEGIELACDILEHFDALIVCGSLYLAADIRALLIEKFTP